MAQTVADHMLERLRQWDVEYVFGYPGDGINAIMGAFGRAGDKPRFIQSRHEEMSAFEAVGYAKFTDKVGVCLATSGPGAIHLLNGLYDAKADHVPVVAIVGQTERSAVGGSYQQEVDLLSLFKDVASDFVQVASVPEQSPTSSTARSGSRPPAGLRPRSSCRVTCRSSSTLHRATRSRRCLPVSG
jgi:pyruvate dehydrogenase (quinone)